jgi:uncharacterized membrane protein YbhN (UPF0104 family)
MHVFVYNLRAIRYRLLLPRDVRPGHMPVLAASAAHNLAAYVLPARSGDASLVLYLFALRVPLPAAAAALVLSRLLDLFALALSLGLACVLIGLEQGSDAPDWIGPTGVALCSIGALILPLARHADRLVAIAARLGKSLGMNRGRLGKRMVELAESARSAMRSAAGGGLLASAGITCLVWLCLFIMYGLLARGFGLPPSVDFPRAVVGAGMAVATNLLPINALAGLGTHEVGWVLGFGFFGIERDLAFSTGVSVHLVQVFNVCLMGFLGHLALGLRRGSSSEQPAVPRSR